MGSFRFKTAKDFYFLGLWLADGYWWSSSVGLSSTNDLYIEDFRSFLKKLCPEHTIKERKYDPKDKKYKGRLVSKHIYVNSRPLTRFFMDWKKKTDLKI